MKTGKAGLRSEGRGAWKPRCSGFNSLLKELLAIRLGWQKTPAKPLVIAPRSSILFFSLLFASSAFGGAQVYTPLSASVRAVLQRSVSDHAAPKLAFANQYEADYWLNEMSRRMQKRLPDTEFRTGFLKTVHYEATRAGLDPELVLGLIEVESGFKKYAVSSVGARGYMQVMPFWTKEIGTADHNLFHLRTNLRYGCTILRHYLDMENGDLFRALGRYNGSLGKPKYPNLVRAAWHKNWSLPRRTADSGDRRAGG